MTGGRAVVPGVVVAIGVLALRMLEGTTVAGPVALRRATDGLTEMQGWLGWQVWDNLSHRRGLLDASVFLDGTASLWSVVGNPGVAALLAPLWGVLAPDAAGLLGFGLLATLNIVAGARFGAGHRVPWLGALAAAGVGAGVQLAGGGFPQALFGPGLLAAAALAAGHARLAVAWTLIGAALAPGPTAGMLLAVGGLPYAALAALGFAVAPFGSGAGPALIAADLFWPGGGAQSALPVAVGLALIALWQARGWSRLLVVLTAAGLLAGVVPEPVAGYQVVGGLAASSAPVAFALALLIGGALPLAATLTRARRTLLGACLVADLVGPVAVGGGRVLETASPVAPVLVSLARSPRRAEVVVIPDSAGAAGVGLIPHHLQHASRAPRLANDPSGGVPLNELRDHIRRSVRPVVVVLLEPEAGQASVLASAFGPPETYAAPMAVWR